jgi:peptide/nickel transport system permease protein
MLKYIAYRLMVMIPTLLAISVLVFVIIQLPPGDFLTTQIAELQAQGQDANSAKIEFLREQYATLLLGMLQGDFGYSFEYDLPVSEVVGDRLFLSFVLSFATIIFTWAMAFPIGVYSAVNQYSPGDHALTFIGFLGLATPNFLLALVMMYLAKAHFGISIGGLMDPEYIDQPFTYGFQLL